MMNISFYFKHIKNTSINKNSMSGLYNICSILCYFIKISITPNHALIL